MNWRYQEKGLHQLCKSYNFVRFFKYFWWLKIKEQKRSNRFKVQCIWRFTELFFLGPLYDKQSVPRLNFILPVFFTMSKILQLRALDTIVSKQKLRKCKTLSLKRSRFVDREAHLLKRDALLTTWSLWITKSPWYLYIQLGLNSVQSRRIYKQTVESWTMYFQPQQQIRRIYLSKHIE